LQRPLPASIAPGRTLTQTDVEGLKGLLLTRDGWIKQYQHRELELGRERASVGAYAGSLLGKLSRRIVGRIKRLFT
jgi:hypothetical protein